MEILNSSTLPDKINNEIELEELLSRPNSGLIEDFSRLDGDIIVLGAGGKIGPSLAWMAKRAAPNKRIIAVSRFSNYAVRQRLESCGVETIACDLLDSNAVEELPKLPNVIYMVSKKFGYMVGIQFGAEGEQPLMWATNTYIPALVAQSFRESRIVAFSASAVYPLVAVTSDGLDENATCEPIGEYANSCVARERIFQFFSQKFGTPGRIVRLNYAVSLNYSVLFDTASRVRDGKKIPLKTGYANVIWQGDASAHILRSLLHCTCPSSPLNIGGSTLVSVRDLAHEFGKVLGKTPIFDGEEEPVDWVNSTVQAQKLFGQPLVPLGKMIDWVVDWVQRH